MFIPLLNDFKRIQGRRIRMYIFDIVVEILTNRESCNFVLRRKFTTAWMNEIVWDIVSFPFRMRTHKNGLKIMKFHRDVLFIVLKIIKFISIFREWVSKLATVYRLPLKVPFLKMRLSRAGRWWEEIHNFACYGWKTEMQITFCYRRSNVMYSLIRRIIWDNV